MLFRAIEPYQIMMKRANGILSGSCINFLHTMGIFLNDCYLQGQMVWLGFEIIVSSEFYDTNRLVLRLMGCFLRD